MAERILVVEDDTKMARLLEMALSAEGYRVQVAHTAMAAMAALERESGIHLVLTDLQLPGESGMDVLKYLKQADRAVPVIILTAYGTIESAVEAIRTGAYDYRTKPVDLEQLKRVVYRALELARLQRENRSLAAQLQETVGFQRIVGTSPKLQSVIKQARAVAQTQSTVLIVGESGTGKELFARAIHAASPRASGPFIAVNCSAFPRDLIESELFGYEKGAFTDARQSKPGRFELAHGGTLFLDEIGDMSLEGQARLLRVLQEREVERLGGTQPIPVDIRVIAATHRNLQDLIRVGRFREDLYYRLNVYPLYIPPLRERPEDIEVLAHYFLRKFAQSMNKSLEGFEPEAMDALKAYPWPGNGREVVNQMERLAIVASGPLVRLEDLPQEIRTRSSDTRTIRPSLLSLGLSLEDMERRLIEEALKHTRGNISRAAALLKVSRGTLRYRIKKYGLHADEESLSSEAARG